MAEARHVQDVRECMEKAAASPVEAIGWLLAARTRVLVNDLSDALLAEVDAQLEIAIRSRGVVNA